MSGLPRLYISIGRIYVRPAESEILLLLLFNTMHVVMTHKM